MATSNRLNIDDVRSSILGLEVDIDRDFSTHTTPGCRVGLYHGCLGGCGGPPEETKGEGTGDFRVTLTTRRDSAMLGKPKHTQQIVSEIVDILLVCW